MSATDVAAHKGAQALGRCGRTALPLLTGITSTSQTLLEVHPSISTTVCANHRQQIPERKAPVNIDNSTLSKDNTTIFQVTTTSQEPSNGDILGKRKRVQKACIKTGAVVSSQFAHTNFEGSSYVTNKEGQSMTLCDSTKVTASLSVAPTLAAGKRKRGAAPPPVSSSFIRGTTEDQLSESLIA